MAARLTRDTRNAVLGGVAAGLGRHLDVDPVLVRLGFVLATLFSGIGLLFYVACWVIIPRDTGAAPPAPPADPGEPREPPLERAAGEVRQAGEALAGRLRGGTSGTGGPRLVIGAFLILLGSGLLLDELHLFHWPHWARVATLWPLVLIGMGVALVYRSRAGSRE